jgi:hypothetical protein
MASVLWLRINYLCTYDLYTAPCVMFLMRADRLRGEVVGGLALEISNFVGPCEMARADRRVHCKC